MLFLFCGAGSSVVPLCDRVGSAATVSNQQERLLCRNTDDADLSQPAAEPQRTEPILRDDVSGVMMSDVESHFHFSALRSQLLSDGTEQPSLSE